MQIEINAKIFIRTHKGVLWSSLFNIILILSVNDLKAQEKDWINERNRESINKFRNDGFLIVRLKSYQGKLDLLNKEVSNPDCHSRCKKKYQRLITKTIKNRDSFNLSLIRAMNQNFHYCKVYFCYDSDWKELSSNEFHGNYLLNEKGQKSDFPSVHIEKAMLLKQDQTTQKSLEALVFQDLNGNNMQSPFPQYVRVNRWDAIWEDIVHPHDKYQRNALRISKSLNVKLNNFKAMYRDKTQGP